MKTLYIIILLIICCACKSNADKAAGNKTTPGTSIHEKRAALNHLNDSALNLMFEFNRTNDTAKLIKALKISDEMFSIDSGNEYKRSNTYLRAQLLFYLGRYKENFKLNDILTPDDKNNIDRIIYEGIKYKLAKNDSAGYYLETALNICKTHLKDSLDIVYLRRMMEIKIIMGQEDEVRILMKDMQTKHPGNSQLQSLSEDMEPTIKIMKALLN